MLDHAGRLDHVAQLHLAPAATRLRRAQRGDQVPRLLLQLLVPECSAATRSLQAGVGALALDLHLLEPPLVAGQRLAERVQQLRDRLLARVRSPWAAVRASLSLVSARVRNCSLFLARASADSSANAPVSAGPFLLGALRRLALERQSCRARRRRRPRRLGRRRRVGHGPELRRLFGQARLRVGQPALGEPPHAGDTRAAPQVPGDADRQPDARPMTTPMTIWPR